MVANVNRKITETDKNSKKFSLFEFVFGLGFTVLVVFALVITFLSFKEYYYDGNFLPVDTISIKGNLSQTSVENISVKLSEAGLLQNYIRLDVNSVQSLIQEIPWIQNVAVRKQWPSSLFLNVIEKKADARWGENQLFSVEVGIFEAQHDDTHASLVLLTGPDDQAKNIYEHYRIFQNILVKDGFLITKVNLTERRSWEIFLENGPSLILGRDLEVINDRLYRFLKVYPFIQNQEQIAYLDLRYDSGLAVGWKTEEITDSNKKSL